MGQITNKHHKLITILTAVLP